MLRGTSNCTYTVALDNSILPTSSNSSSPAMSDVLFTIVDLSPELHNVTLTAQPTNDLQVLSFSGGIVSSVANSTWELLSHFVALLASFADFADSVGSHLQTPLHTIIKTPALCTPVHGRRTKPRQVFPQRRASYPSTRPQSRAHLCT